MGAYALGQKMIGRVASLGGKALKTAGALGSKISDSLLETAGMVENTIPLVQSIPGYETAKGMVRLGGRVANFAERAGDALQAPTLQAGLDRLAPLIRDVQAVHNRGQQSTTKEGFVRSELERG